MFTIAPHLLFLPVAVLNNKKPVPCCLAQALRAEQHWLELHETAPYETLITSKMALSFSSLISFSPRRLE